MIMLLERWTSCSIQMTALQRAMTGAACSLFIAACNPEPAVKFRDSKEPNDLAALRAVSNHGQLGQCGIAAAPASADWIYLDASDDGLKLKLPPDWKVTSRDTIAAPQPFGGVESRMKDSALRSIRVKRVANSLASRSYIKDVKPDRQCEMSTARHGSIWSLYSIATQSGPPGANIYIGFGDLLTAGGKRYHVSVSAGTEGDRDWLARIVADASGWQ